MNEYDHHTFNPNILIGHYDLISWFSDFALYLNTEWVYDHISIHVIPPSSSGRLQEMSRKIGKISSKMYHFFNKNSNLPEMNQEFSYIFYTFSKNLPEMKEKSP